MKDDSSSPSLESDDDARTRIEGEAARSLTSALQTLQETARVLRRSAAILKDSVLAARMLEGATRTEARIERLCGASPKHSMHRIGMARNRLRVQAVPNLEKLEEEHLERTRRQTGRAARTQRV